MTKIVRALRLLSSLMDGLSMMTGGITAVFVIVLMLIVCFEVVMRYVFTSPTIWVFETSENLLVLIVFLPLAYVLTQEAHITVDMVTVRLSQRTKTILLIATSFLTLLFCTVLAWQGWELALRSYDRGTRVSSSLGTPLVIPQLLIPIGVGLWALQLVSNICVYIRALSSENRRRSKQEKGT